VTFARYRAKKLAHFVRKMASDPDAPRSLPRPCKDTAAAPGTTGGRAVLNAR
jgi:hypothetical protein